MVSRFTQGSKAYTRTGRVYTVEEVEGGVVYCSLPNGAETEFPEASLLTEEEWAAAPDVRRDVSYSMLRQARAYTTTSDKLDPAASAQLLLRAEKLAPGLLDFVAFMTAERTLTESHQADLIAGLSIVKCREIFDDAAPEIRATLLAEFLGHRPDALVNATKLGDNVAGAMLEKGLAPYSEAFEEFLDRPRR